MIGTRYMILNIIFCQKKKNYDVNCNLTITNLQLLGVTIVQRSATLVVTSILRYKNRNKKKTISTDDRVGCFNLNVFRR